MQYGIKTTADLFNQRQGIALLEVQAEIERAFGLVNSSTLTAREQKALKVLLTLILNRLLMYNSRHSWWQPKGEFPANIFVRQAIPMVWSYVEMPVDSPAAGGFSSALKWMCLVADHCRKLPRRGTVAMSDAAKCELADSSVDVMTLDPPYYDVIVYAYLSDVFYVWMRSLLSDVLPGLFKQSVTPKLEEAIVDRPHKMAPSPKGDKHFRRKMTEAFCEVRRVLKPDGRLLLMFGHKKGKAWDAIMTHFLTLGLAQPRLGPCIRNGSQNCDMAILRHCLHRACWCANRSYGNARERLSGRTSSLICKKCCGLAFDDTSKTIFMAATCLPQQ